MTDVDELKTRLINVCTPVVRSQLIIYVAISQWRRRLSTCVRVRCAHFEHNF